MITLLCIFCLTGLYFIYRKLKSDERKKRSKKESIGKVWEVDQLDTAEYPTMSRNRTTLRNESDKYIYEAPTQTRNRRSMNDR